MALQFTTLDSLGSFRTADGQFEAICWTHRGEGWCVCDWRMSPGQHHYAPTKREAQRLVRRLAKGGTA